LAQALLIRGARQLLTLRGARGARRGSALSDLAVIEDGSLLIRDGVIMQVGSTRRIDNLKESRGAVEIAVDGTVVMPGLVDPSVHVSLNSPKRRSAGVFGDGVAALFRSCVQHGTLHVQVKGYAPGQSLRANLTLLRQLSNAHNRLTAPIRCWRIEDHGSAFPATSDLASALALIARRKLAHRVEVSPELSPPIAETVWAAARSEKLGVNLSWPGGSVEALRTGLMRAQPRMISCQHQSLTAAECELLGRCSMPVVLTPARSLAENTRSDNARCLIEAGAAVALASGYHEEDMPVFNLQTAIALAVLRLGFSTEQAIAAATVNAAYAAGLGHATGTLETGKRADLLVLDLHDYGELPHRFGSNHVVLAMREGRVVFNRTGRKVGLA
jgi:imidazolonepropionase